MAKIILPIAEGFEEIEAVSIIDVCRRAGIEVVAAGVDSLEIKGANGITLKADCLIESVNESEFDMIVLPGGWGGTHVLAKNNTVQEMLKSMKNSDKYVAAVCAAPFALHTAGVLNQNYTCYPSVEEQIRMDGYTDSKKVVMDGKVITSRGPGTSICFALEIVKLLVDEETSLGLKEGLLATYC
jgi:4-methyl-5(b-hydroxyethyl)-thiazole monophosphate biosynthesis